MKVRELDANPVKRGPLYEAKLPETLEDVDMQMELLTTEGDEAVAHIEADRLLHCALILAAKDKDIAASIITHFNKIDKYYE